MKILRVIIQIAILYVFSFAGEFLHNRLNIPIPGSIIGMVLLLLCLSLKIVPINWIEDGAGFLLVFLPLLFIPAIVGIMNHPSLLSVNGAVLIVITVLSTFITMIAAGSMSQFLEQQAQKRKEKKKWNKRYLQ